MFLIREKTLLLALFVVFACGCTRYVWNSQPYRSQVDNDYFTAEISPICNVDGCKSFNLIVMNKTDKNLELDWNKTFYIIHGQKTGGFMFEGVTYKDRHNARPPDIISSGDELSARIWPNNLVCYVIGKNGGWQKKPMSMGENGVYLTVIIDGKEVSEKLSVSLSKMPVQ